jgi:tetratricopeptide (TPR) repeat protein
VLSAPAEREFRSRRIEAIACAALAAVAVLAAGCGSGPVRAFAGARAYADGTAALDSGDYDLAISRLEVAAERVPHASEIWNHLGLAYWSAGRPAAARDAFERAVELDCDNAAARVNLARFDAEASVVSSTSVAAEGTVEEAVIGGSTDGER